MIHQLKPVLMKKLSVLLLVTGLIIWLAGATQAQSAIPLKLTADGIRISVDNRLTYCNGRLYFGANESPFGEEPWISDGTVAGTSRLRDIAIGSEGSYPRGFTPLNTLVFFTASSRSHGRELWVHDGTRGTTYLVKDICPGTEGSAPTGLTVSNHILYFSANDGVTGRELWRSDGTAAGTYLVKNISTVVSGTETGSFPEYLTDLDGVLYFAAYTPATGTELYRSDGTTAGTLIVSDIVSGTASSSPNSGSNPVTAQFTKVGNKLFFVASNGTTGAELWKTDGTAAGTLLVKDIRPGSETSDLNAFRMHNDRLYLCANDGVNGGELWKSDGTAKGTYMVKDISPGPRSSFPQKLMTAGGQLFFTAFDETHGLELWKSDGTSAGTSLVKDINPGPGSMVYPGYTAPYAIEHIENAGGSGIYLYFKADDGAGYALWRSDGTLAGTRRAFSHSYDGIGAYSITHGNYTYFESEGVYRVYYPLARIGVSESEPEWNVSVLGNPVKGDQLTVEVNGAGGQPLTLSLMDEQGKSLLKRHIEQAAPVERQSIPVDTRPVGVLFLNVVTPTKSKTIKLLKD